MVQLRMTENVCSAQKRERREMNHLRDMQRDGRCLHEGELQLGMNLWERKREM